MDRMIKDKVSGKFVKHDTPNTCTIDGCTSPVRGHGLCNKHLLRVQRHGDPFFRKRKANGEGPKYHRNKKYRIIKTKDGKWKGEHRLVASAILDRQLQAAEIVHHKDNDPSNNAPDNLAVMSRRDHVFKHPEVLDNLSLGPKCRWGTR